MDNLFQWFRAHRGRLIGAVAGAVLLLGVSFYLIYSEFRIDVPAYHIAVLTRKTGIDMPNSAELAPDETFKGLQRDVLTEGRYYYNPYGWDWDVVPQVEIPPGKLGVRIRLYGDDLKYGKIIAEKETDKGIVPNVLRPGRYAINAIVVDGVTKELISPQREKDNFVEIIELYDPVKIPAGYRGVLTLLQADMPDDPNVLLVENGKRGPQKESYQEGTKFVNPFIERINLVDCRSQRYNMGDKGDFGFPSRDGFWVVLEGIIEFRVKPEMASEVYVTYNDVKNGDEIDFEVIQKIILPNARSFCRLEGSDHAGRDFIGGDTRIKFQNDFQKAMEQACDPLGVQIIQALITRIKPPEAIADPIREREVEFQRAEQYVQQVKQQEAEQLLAIEQAMIKRKSEMVGAEQEVVVITVAAQRDQEVAITKVNERKVVAQFKLDAAEDEAAAVVARGEAVAKVIMFDNEAAAAGWRAAVAAFNGEGKDYAKYILFQKLAPGFRSIMANTADSPLMQIFEDFAQKGPMKKVQGGLGKNGKK